MRAIISVSILRYFFDLPSLIIIPFVLHCILNMMGLRKEFVRSFEILNHKVQTVISCNTQVSIEVSIFVVTFTGILIACTRSFIFNKHSIISIVYSLIYSIMLHHIKDSVENILEIREKEVLY